MRILHIDTGREMRGGQWQALLLMREQARAGHLPTLLAPASAALAEAATRRGIRVVRNLTALPGLSQHTEIVHCHDARAHTLAALLSSAPFVVSRRVAFAVRGGPLSRWKYRRAAHYLAVSEFVRQDLLRAGIPEERISLVPDGVELPRTLSTRSGGAVAIPSGDPRKGTALIEDSGANVKFARDVQHEMATARVFVYITEMEGLGSGALLAMAHAVPVIASRVGGLPEVVRDGETGLLVENEPGAIAAAIERLLADAALAARLGAAARRQVEENYTLPLLAGRTMAAYRKVLDV